MLANSGVFTRSELGCMVCSLELRSHVSVVPIVWKRISAQIFNFRNNAFILETFVRKLGNFL